MLCVIGLVATSANRTVVFGKITNAKDTKVYLMRELAFTQNGWPVIDSTATDQDGRYRITLDLVDPLVGALGNSSRNLRIFLSPGDSLQIDFDVSNWPGSVVFSGTGGPENTFYMRYRQQFMPNVAQNKLYGSRPQYFAFLCDSLYNAAGKAFQETFTSTKANPSFEAFLSQKAMYLAAARKMMFPVYQRFVQRADSDEARIDTLYYAFLRNTPFDNPVAYHTDTYADFLYWYYKERAYEALNTKKLTENAEPVLAKQFDLAIAELKGKPLEIAAAAIVSKMFDNNYVTNAGRMIDYLKKQNLSGETLRWLERRYAQMAHLAIGAPAKDFALPDTSGKMISLASMKGKVVYIDMWASWCGPCRKEMPHSRALMEKLKGEPVTFLFVSIDEKPEAWRKALAQEKLPGVHVLDKKGWGSTLTDDYNFHSIPHYILIDQNGKMANPDAARPSGGAYEQIKALLDRNEKP